MAERALVTHDAVLRRGRGAITEADREIRDPATPCLELSPAEAAAVSRAAQRAYARFQRIAAGAMTRERAVEIRVWRVNLKCSWRKVAELAHAGWGAKWSPPSHQLAGLALCCRAAALLGEDALAPPWNHPDG